MKRQIIPEYAEKCPKCGRGHLKKLKHITYNKDEWIEAICNKCNYTKDYNPKDTQ